MSTLLVRAFLTLGRPKSCVADRLSNLAASCAEEPDMLSTALVLLYFTHVAVMALIAALTMYINLGRPVPKR